MTIDEHFIYMVCLEALIFFIGMGLMYYQQKRTADLMEQILTQPEYAATVAKNMVFGLMDDITNDKEKQAIFFGFLQSCAVTGVVGVREYFGDKVAAGVTLPKRHALKPVEGIINQILPGVFDNILKGGQKKVEKAAEAALEGW